MTRAMPPRPPFFPYSFRYALFDLDHAPRVQSDHLSGNKACRIAKTAGPVALKLWWKNVTFIQHSKYTNPSYREEALKHDRKLQCCPRNGTEQRGIHAGWRK
ncbi:uncharacterized protein LOC111278088 [Durio zibethinus]|uniref:Uncharacterized protein LOC111278088 n=1 Tax=Durio zibethinus TaxID=66656 RepID=A0A6P5WVV6_DURZI|nr:uncharacterized protein LOC111278088 [Durio zibethinus]